MEDMAEEMEVVMVEAMGADMEEDTVEDLAMEDLAMEDLAMGDLAMEALAGVAMAVAMAATISVRFTGK